MKISKNENNEMVVILTDEEIRDSISRNSSYWRLYHSYKNEDPILWVIVLSFLAIFIKDCGFVLSIGIWVYYIYYCIKNNSELNRNPRIIEERKSYKNFLERRIYSDIKKDHDLENKIMKRLEEVEEIDFGHMNLNEYVI